MEMPFGEGIMMRRRRQFRVTQFFFSSSGLKLFLLFLVFIIQFCLLRLLSGRRSLFRFYYRIHFVYILVSSSSAWCFRCAPKSKLKYRTSPWTRRRTRNTNRKGIKKSTRNSLELVFITHNSMCALAFCVYKFTFPLMPSNVFSRLHLR